MQESEQKGAENRSRFYTYADEVFRFFDDMPYFHLNMDTWYYARYADPNHWATFGSMRLGEQPLLPTQGVGSFIAKQIAAFKHAFSGLLVVSYVHVGYKPRLEGVNLSGYGYDVPQTDGEIAAIGDALQAQPYGIISLTLGFELIATIRNESGRLEQVRLPYAGEALYSARYTDGYISNLPHSVVAAYILTPEAQRGMAIWEVKLVCNFVSLFKRDNSEVLARVRERWRQWEREHPGERYVSPNDDEVDNQDYEDYIVTLTDPSPGAPVDNAELYAINTPRLRKAIATWERELGLTFEWDNPL